MGKQTREHLTKKLTHSITKAREAGVIVTADAIADYYGDVFEFDWYEGATVSDADAQLISVHPADWH